MNAATLACLIQEKDLLILLDEVSFCGSLII
jgi:hypothetical protein